MASLVILFTVMRGSGAMCVRSKFMKLGRTLVGIIWHFVASVANMRSLQLFLCSIVNTLFKPGTDEKLRTETGETGDGRDVFL
jgi:hypothetical protein